MGSCGIASLGCTIGQGVTGMALLSIGSFLAIASILPGARFGLHLPVEAVCGSSRSLSRLL
jgi:hypothetical protein